MTKKYPTRIRSARRMGWTIIEPKYTSIDSSYLGLQIWTDRRVCGKYISSFNPTRFAFELPSDATMFALRWA